MTLDDLLRESVLRHADRPALAWAAERLSYRELGEAVDALAVRVGGTGDAQGRTIALIAPNTPALVVGLFAIWRLGATAVPLNARLREHELRHILADAKPAALVSVEAHLGYSFRELAARLVPDLPSLFVDADARVVAENRLSVETTQAHSAPDVAAILYTSGTSGEPKRTLVPHRRELDGARHLTEILELEPEDAVAFVIPLSHAFGFSCLHACVGAGAAAVLVDSTTSLGPLLDAVSASQATVLHGSPRLFSSLLDAAPEGLPSVRTGFVAGSASPPRLLERLDAAGMRILNLYGLTELGAVAACRADDPEDVRYTTAGRALPGHALRTVDGELHVLSPYEDGWFATGDLAELEDGCVRITGRISELVNVGGFNVSPAEVEAVLLGHPHVSAAAVIGVDERLQAFVVARAGAVLDRADLLGFARARIAGYKLPYAIHVVSELPLLPSGKPDRQALRAA